jgi:DnaJ-class molecular chaperone
MKCPRCKGKMRIKDYQKDNEDSYMPCPTCEGEGTIEGEDKNGMW